MCHVDDVLVFLSTQQEHARLRTALSEVQAAALTLSKEKCEFHKERVTFLGHFINKSGISANPQKASGILEMRKPQLLYELRQFMGRGNQPSKFSLRIAEV